MKVFKLLCSAGFRRSTHRLQNISGGAEIFQHPCFQRGRPDLLRFISRTGVRRAQEALHLDDDDETEADMLPQANTGKGSKSTITDSHLETIPWPQFFSDFRHPVTTTAEPPMPQPLPSQPQQPFHVDSVCIY